MKEHTSTGNGDYSDFVTRSEQHNFANHVLEAIGGLTAEVSRLSHKVDQRFDELTKVDEGMRRKVRSLPNLVAEAMEEAEETTKITELKRKLAEVEKKKKFWMTNGAAIMVLLLGTVIAGVVLRLLGI